jgi:hypothetical protein
VSIRLGVVRRHIEERNLMRVLVMVKATKNSEAGIRPGDPGTPAGFDKLLEEMGKFNEELIKAGVLLAADGLHPSSKGKRVRFTGSNGKRTVVDGPFTETKELVAGFWIWKVKSIAEAVKWVRRCPDPMPGEESEIEIRPIIEAEEFGKEFARAKEKRMRLLRRRSRR